MVLAVAGILVFYPTIVAPPGAVTAENLHIKDISSTLNGFSAQQTYVYNDSVYVTVTDKIELYRKEGFLTATMSDFPVRDRRVELHIRRRRWLTPDGRSVILNIYPLVAEGSRYSVAFAEFLKKTWIRPR